MKYMNKAIGVLSLVIMSCNTPTRHNTLHQEHDVLIERIRTAASLEELNDASTEADNLYKLILSESSNRQSEIQAEALKGTATLALFDKAKALRDSRLLELQTAIDIVQNTDRCASIDETPSQIEDRLCRITEIHKKAMSHQYDDQYLGTEFKARELDTAVQQAEERLRRIQDTGYLYRKPPRFTRSSEDNRGIRR